MGQEFGVITIFPIGILGLMISSIQNIESFTH
jgi:hypothetical protein